MRGLAIIVASFLIWAHVGLAPAQQPAPDALPTTVEGVVRDIIAQLSADDRARIKSTRKEHLIKFHHGWGTGIRNRYGLWGDNTKLLHAACGKPCHPDEASMIIIEAVWAALQK